MKVHTNDLEAADAILLKGEHVEGSATQMRIGGSLISPISVLVTGRRIIVIKRAVFGLRHDHEVFSLAIVTSIKVKHGLISSSIFIRTQGSEGDKSKSDNGTQDGEISGLRKNDAENLVTLINKNIAQREVYDSSGRHEVERGHSNISHRHDASPNEGYQFCSRCGTKIFKTAKFCKNCGSRV